MRAHSSAFPNGRKCALWVSATSADVPQLCNRLTANHLASVFKVSSAAAQIRMNQLHLDFQAPQEAPSVLPVASRNARPLSELTEDDMARIEKEHYTQVLIADDLTTTLVSIRFILYHKMEWYGSFSDF